MEQHGFEPPWRHLSGRISSGVSIRRFCGDGSTITPHSGCLSLRCTSSDAVEKRGELRRERKPDHAIALHWFRRKSARLRCPRVVFFVLIPMLNPLDTGMHIFNDFYLLLDVRSLRGTLFIHAATTYFLMSRSRV